MKNKTNLFLGIIILVLAIVIVGLVINQSNSNENSITENINSSQNFQSLEERYDNLTYSNFEAKKNGPFMEITPDELLTLLTTTNQTSSYGTRGMSDSLVDMAMTSMPMDSAKESQAGGDIDYSETNVQVSGIDEGDIVKTDGKKIFIAKNKKITVINKVDIPILEEDKYSITIEDKDSENINIKAMFIDTEENILYAIIEKHYTESKFTQYSVLYPEMQNIPFTVIKTFKIEENSLTEINSIETKGSYFQSRMKDGIVYNITIDYLNNFKPILYYDTVMLPIKETRNEIVSNFQPKIIVPRDVTEENKVMYNLTSLSYSENTSSLIDSIDLILNSSNTVYMSNNNLYIATEKNNYFPFFRFGWYNESRDVVFEEIYSKIYPSDVSSEIKKNLEDQEKLVEILNNYYQTLNSDQKEELYNKIEQETDKYNEERRNENNKTFINRIELLTDGTFGDILEGEVKGRLLNQFSLDEKDGYLRIATTYQDYNGYRSTNNNAVTILNSSLKEVGIVDKIAPDETIYSARFMGDKLYLVTYRQVDPFFVIDLSEPTNPEILGELKISGYSDYLHPISDTLILGVGQETEVNQWGGENRIGVKIALFDVSDFSDPKEMGKWISQASYSNTKVSSDHKAFLYIPKNDLVIIPISESFNTKASEFNFVILKVNENGVSEVTKIKHPNTNYYSSIARSLYIEDHLYTITDNLLKTYNFESQEETEVVIGKEDIIYIDNR